MFDRFIDWVKGVWNKLLGKDEIKKAIGVEPCISQTFLDRIALWNNMLCGKAPWVNEDVKSLQVEQGICREFANVCLTEMEAKVSDKQLDNIFQGAIKDLNEYLQDGIGLGSFIIKPLGGNKVEYIPAGAFIPIQFDDRKRLTHVAFITTKKVGENGWYRKFEIHRLTAQGLIIENKVFYSQTESILGRQVEMSEVEEWAKISPGPLLYKIDRPDFGYYRNPIPNKVDGSHCGVSIFESAISLIKSADTQFGRLNWEFESGERAIQVDIAAIKKQTMVDGDGREVVNRLSGRLYKGLDQDKLFNEFSPQFRDESIINGLNAMLRRIEFNTCLSYGDLSDVQEVQKTATEMIIAKKRKYNMVNAIEQNLKECLEDLVFALAFYNNMTTRKPQLVCSFKDSVLTDEETERKQDMADMAAGIMRPEEYRAKWYNETLDDAIKNLPDQAEVIE